MGELNVPMQELTISSGLSVPGPCDLLLLAFNTDLCTQS